MVPKFRGGAEDWLDQTEAKSQRQSTVSKKKTTTARATHLPASEANATVAEVFQNQCRVRPDRKNESSNDPKGGLNLNDLNDLNDLNYPNYYNDQQDQGVSAENSVPNDLLCSYRRANVVGKSSEYRERTPVAVGDRVLVRSTGGTTGVIEGICVRKKTLSRLAPGRDTGQFQHILAANVDLLVIVASATNPPFTPVWVDRLMVAASAEDIDILLCITKIDLFPGTTPPWQIYRDLGYSVAEVCAKQNQGIPALTELLIKKTVVFCGQSGVGKTSLLRTLTGKSIGKVGAVNESTGQGRHTTTSAILLPAPHQSQWIDTPGMREFDLVKISAAELIHCFPEFKKLKCEKKECHHDSELGCRARDLPRYPSYLKILRSLTDSAA